MALHKVVIGEMKGNGSFEVFQLLAESVSESCQSAHVKAGRAVQSFDVAGGSQPHVRGAHNAAFLDRDKLGGAVLALWPLIVIRSIRLDDLSVVNVRSEGQFNGLDISPKRIAGKLNAIIEP